MNHVKTYRLFESVEDEIYDDIWNMFKYFTLEFFDSGNSAWTSNKFEFEGYYKDIEVDANFKKGHTYLVNKLGSDIELTLRIEKISLIQNDNPRSSRHNEFKEIITNFKELYTRIDSLCLGSKLDCNLVEHETYSYGQLYHCYTIEVDKNL